MTRPIVFLAALCLMLGLPLSPAAAQKRVALVIGNDSYQHVTPLRKAANDADRMAKTLKGLGFQVIAATNQDRRGMSNSLSAFERALAPGDTAFFFAGHGFQIKGENYLLPTDVPLALAGEEEKVHENSFLARRIMERVRNKGARTTVVVLDACRDNPFERAGTRSVGGAGGLAAMSEEGAFVIYSASENQTALDYVSDDDKDPNSVFTRFFAKELETPGLSLVQVAKRTQASVAALARKVKHDQRPAYYDEIIGDVVLNGTLDPNKTKETVPQQVAAVTPVQPSPLPSPRSEPEQLNAPLANFMRHNGGWSVTLSFADPVTAISWRFGESGNFRETGHLNTLDPRTRKRMPNPSIQLDADTPEGTLYIRYADARGEWAEPFPVKFDPAGALERSQREILEMTSGSWLSFREFNGLMVYYTHLLSYRCAIRDVKIGIDSTVPDKKLALPPCDPRDPSSVPSSAQPYMKLPPKTKVMSVELTYRDGTTSEVKTFRADPRGNR